MNVMAQAHKDCKARIAAGNPNRYADLFRVALRQAHKEFKAMQTKDELIAQYTKQAEERIIELEAMEHTDGFIVVVGDNIRLPFNEVQGKWCRVETASIYWHVEDARYFANRVVNGNGEKGQVVRKVDQIAWEIEQQKIMLEQFKNM